MSKLQYEVFLRSLEFERAAVGIQMRPMDWHLLLALDGRTALGDLAHRLLLDVDEAVDTVVVAERLRMVERRRLSLSEYRSEFGLRSAENPGFAPHAAEPAAEAEPPAALEEPADVPGVAAATRLPATEGAPAVAAFASEASALEPELAEEPARFARYAPFSEPPKFGEEPEFAEPASPAGFDTFAGSASVMLGEASEARLETFHVMRDGVTHHVVEYADVRHELQDEAPAPVQDAPHEPELVGHPELVEGRAEEPATEDAPPVDPAVGHRIAAWAEAPPEHETASGAQAPAEPAVEPQPPAEPWAPVAAEPEAPSMPEVPAAEPELRASVAWEAATPAAQSFIPPVVKPIEFKLRPSVQVVIR